MKKIILTSLLFIFLCRTLYAQFFIKNTQVFVKPTTTVFVKNMDISMQTGADYVNHGTIILAATGPPTHWSDNTGGTGCMNLASTGLTRTLGPAMLLVDGTTSTRHFNFHMQNGGGVSLARDIEIHGTLTLYSGIITTNANNVISSNTANAAVVADITNPLYGASYINGTLIRSMPALANGVFDFPVGTATSNPLYLTANALAGISNITAWFQNPKPGTDVGLVAVEPTGGLYGQVAPYGVWHFLPNTITGGTANLQLYMNGFSGLVDNSFAPLVRPNLSSTASQWYVPLTSTLNAAGSPGRTVASNFAARNFIPASDLLVGQWGIGMTSSPLPIELLTFTGIQRGQENIISWTTASMTNVKEFQVQKSFDCKEFISFATVIPESPNSTTLETYHVADLPLAGVTYYRLKEVDLNETTHYSKVIAVISKRLPSHVKEFFDFAGRKLNTSLELEKLHTNFYKVLQR